MLLVCLTTTKTKIYNTKNILYIGEKMIYDCFPFFNELDILEIRLNELNDVVDKFVLVEATKTHSGKDKPLFFEENKNRFSKFLDKIIHIVVDDDIELKSTWSLENYQRNCISRGLTNCKDDDIILISDCDEIPNPQEIIKNKDVSGLKIFKQKCYFYYLNLRNSNNWPQGTRMLSYKDFKNGFDNVDNYSKSIINELNLGTTATKIRGIFDGKIIKNGGWHFTYIGGIDMILKKLTSYSHCDEVKKEDFDKANLQRQIRIGGTARFGQGSFLYPVKIDNTFPKYIINNQDKFKDFILVQTKKEKILCLGAIISNIIFTQPIVLLKKFAYFSLGAKKVSKIKQLIKR